MINLLGLRSELEKIENFIVVGIGNPLKGDDIVGTLVAEKLIEKSFKDKVINAEAVPENFIDEMISKNPDVIIFVDAIDAGLKPGSILVEELEKAKERNYIFTSHNIPLTLLLNYVKKRLSKNVKAYLVGIQVYETGLGSTPHPKVLEAVKKLVDFFSSLL